MSKQQIGVIGLAVMGKNLALNIASRGYSVSVYNRSEEKTRQMLAEHADANVVGTYSLEQFVDSLEKPRKILIMVKAGSATDATIEQVVPLLEEGDILIDGGNAFFEDTLRRSKELESKGIRFIGTGVSGGEEGALKGPAIMPGGQESAYKLVEPILTAISAKVNGEPCCAYIGTDGAGHFVKMVHNGIEYGDMQLICEAYFLMKELLCLTPAQMSEIFARWNEGELQSYLIEITADILRAVDAETKGPLVDVILDEAGHKGTGKWTSEEALSLGVGAPTITEAVYARYISAIKGERVQAASTLPGPGARGSVDPDALVQAIGSALYAAKICSYAQGFALLRAAAREYDWELNFGEIASLWRGGCIIRAQFLDRIREAYDASPALANLLLAPYFTQSIASAQKEWREVVSLAALNGIPVPGFSSALAYYDQYRLERLPANLLQAQRDYFGAHTYRRIDKDGTYHTEWLELVR